MDISVWNATPGDAMSAALPPTTLAAVTTIAPASLTHPPPLTTRPQVVPCLSNTYSPHPHHPAATMAATRRPAVAFVGGASPLVSLSPAAAGSFACRARPSGRVASTAPKPLTMLVEPVVPVVAPLLELAANPAWLVKVGDAVGTLPFPPAVVKYGHPALMGFMLLGMGTPGGVIGWLGRTNDDKVAGAKQKQLHENIMLAFWLLAFAGATGGILSTVMQGKDILQSPHALSAGVVLALLTANATVAYSGFSIGGDSTSAGRQQGRTLHAYLGAGTMVALLVHGVLGVANFGG